MNLDIKECTKVNITNIKTFINNFYNNAKLIFNNHIIQDALKYKVYNCEGHDLQLLFKQYSSDIKHLIYHNKYIYIIESEIQFYAFVSILSYFYGTSTLNKDKFKHIKNILNSIEYISQDTSKSNLTFYVGFNEEILDCFEITKQKLNSFLKSIEKELKQQDNITKCFIDKLNKDYENCEITLFDDIEEFILDCISEYDDVYDIN
jgi:hypothetical protein